MELSADLEEVCDQIAEENPGLDARVAMLKNLLRIKCETCSIYRSEMKRLKSIGPMCPDFAGRRVSLLRCKKCGKCNTVEGGEKHEQPVVS